jgi:predicted metal-dependent peptidase
MSYSKQDLETAFDKAKIGLMTKHNSIFITTILFSLKHTWDESCKTAGTNGVDLVIAPTWFMSMTAGARMGLLAHEAWHVAFNHMTRGDSYEHKEYNIAADHVINVMLKDASYELPEGGYGDFKYRGWSTDEVYKDLQSNPKPPPPKGGEGSGGCGQDIKYPSDEKDKDGKGNTQKQKDNLQRKIEDTLIKATTQSKIMGDAAGTIPGDISRMLDELLNPKLDWKTLLSNYMNAFAKEDYSYQRPNKRFMPDFFLPGMHSESLGEICFACDASGSVSQADFTAYLNEINYVKEELNPVLTTIIDFDTRINNVHSLGQDDSIEGIKFTGGGGTNLTPVFDYYSDRKPVVLVVFSDLYCSMIKNDPGYPVLWVCVNNPRGQVNFGTIIHIDL